MIRRMLELASRNRSFRRRMPARFGSRNVYVSGDSALSYLMPSVSKSHDSLLDVAAEFATGATSVWDIGSNCGVFAVAAAHFAAPYAQILAVEPDPFLASLIQKTKTDPTNSDINLCVLCAAVTDGIGISPLRIAERGRSSNSLEGVEKRSQAGGIRFTQHVPTFSLDNLLAHFAPPSLLKIDVEGAEVAALRGATDMLRTVRPIVYIEVGPCLKDSATAFFLQHDYVLFDGDLTTRHPIASCAFNTIALPREATSRYCDSQGTTRRP